MYENIWAVSPGQKSGYNNEVTVLTRWGGRSQTKRNCGRFKAFIKQESHNSHRKRQFIHNLNTNLRGHSLSRSKHGLLYFVAFLPFSVMLSHSFPKQHCNSQSLAVSKLGILVVRSPEGQGALFVLWPQFLVFTHVTSALTTVAIRHVSADKCCQ